MAISWLKVPKTIMLDQMTNRLRGRKTFESAIETILDDVIALHGAEFGDVQLPIGDELVIVAQRGLTSSFLEAFKRVNKNDGCACGRAFRSGDPVVIRDVQRDEAYAPFRADATAAGYRGVQTTPLTTTGGMVVGLVSTLFALPHEPTPIEMGTLKTYSRIASEYLWHLLGGATLDSKAEEMSRALYEVASPRAPSDEIERRFT